MRVVTIAFLLVVGTALHAGNAMQPPAAAPTCVAPAPEYRNPVIFADTPDPDCIRIGDTYYAVASSFNLSPGLPLLQSTDLVNWRLVGHALPRLKPEAHFALPRRGDGVWAPSIRHHKGLFHIYYPDPDFGIWLTTASRFEGPWSDPVLVRGGKGLIDPCPLFDDDGRVWLVHAWAKSRAGFANRITLLELDESGTKVIADHGTIIDGDSIPGFRTLEGPKIYKREGLYWIFAPAGGVDIGWQTVFRAKELQGPYEHRIVLEQGPTPINGPHQGAWIDDVAGGEWFLHFQDRGPYGRIPHLQPMRWNPDGWPVMGEDPDGDGCGQPVLIHPVPAHTACAANRSKEHGLEVQKLHPWNAADPLNLPLDWNWEGNPLPEVLLQPRKLGQLRLKAIQSPSLWEAANVVSHSIPGPKAHFTVLIDVSELKPGQRAGLAVLSRDCDWLQLRCIGDSFVLERLHRPRTRAAGAAAEEKVLLSETFVQPRVHLRLTVQEHAPWQLSYSLDGAQFEAFGPSFMAAKGWWLGARLGLFCLTGKETTDPEQGSASFSPLRTEFLP